MNRLALIFVSLSSIFFTSACLTTRADLRGEGDGRRKVQDQVTVMQEKRANETSRLDEFDQQFRNMNGRIEVIENQVSQIDAGQKGQQEENRQYREQADQRLKIYEEALHRLEAQLGVLNDELKSLRTARSEKPAATKSSFDQAEAAFAKKEWKQAIVDFESYRKGNAKGKHYAAATLKIGMAFHELGMKDEAKAFYEEVKTKFPSSKEAKTASKRLKAVK